jgi:hypothetical protein
MGFTDRRRESFERLAPAIVYGLAHAICSDKPEAKEGLIGVR